MIACALITPKPGTCIPFMSNTPTDFMTVTLTKEEAKAAKIALVRVMGNTTSQVTCAACYSVLAKIEKEDERSPRNINDLRLSQGIKTMRTDTPERETEKHFRNGSCSCHYAVPDLERRLSELTTKLAETEKARDDAHIFVGCYSCLGSGEGKHDRPCCICGGRKVVKKLANQLRSERDAALASLAVANDKINTWIVTDKRFKELEELRASLAEREKERDEAHAALEKLNSASARDFLEASKRVEIERDAALASLAEREKALANAIRQVASGQYEQLKVTELECVSLRSTLAQRDALVEGLKTDKDRLDNPDLYRMEYYHSAWHVEMRNGKQGEGSTLRLAIDKAKGTV